MMCSICKDDFILNEIHLHHIKTRKERPELIKDPNNLIAVCSTCHHMIHSNGIILPIADKESLIKLLELLIKLLNL